MSNAIVSAQQLYEDATEPRTLESWSEDDGACLWWKFPIEEPPYCGTPLDVGFTVEVNMLHYVGGVGNVKQTGCSSNVGGWPGYHTHWTPLLRPRDP